MSHRATFNPRPQQHPQQQAQGATGHEGSYNEPSASTNTMDAFSNPNENDYHEINPLQHIGIHGNQNTLDWLISTYGGPSQTNLGPSTSPSHTISPSIYSSLNTPAEHMGASPYLPTPVDFPTTSHPFPSAAATTASGGNPSLFAQTSSSPLVHAHPSHFVSTSTIPHWHSPPQDSILSSSAPASMSPLHYTSHNQHQQQQQHQQQPLPRFGGGSASANTSPFGPPLYQPTSMAGQIGPSLFQNNPLTLPPHPPLTNVTHSPLLTSSSNSSGGPPPPSLTNLRISAVHHQAAEPLSASTPLDASSLPLFPLSQSSTTSSGSSTSAGTAGAPASELPHAYLARNTTHLSTESRELVEKKWSVWANDPVRQRKIVDILTAWYGNKQRPSNADLMFFHRKLYGNDNGIPLPSHHGATSSIDSQDDVFSAPSTSAAAMNPSSSAVAVGSSSNSNNRRGGGAGTRGGPIGYECLWPNGGCANPLKARADRIQEDALIHLGIKTHICEPCGSDFLRKNELTRHQKTCKNHNAALNTQEDPAHSSKGGRAKETPRKSSGPSISPISLRFPNAVRKNLDRSIRGISSSEPPAESGTIAGVDNYRGGRNSLDSAVFAPMAPGGAGGEIGGNSSGSSTQVSPVNTRDLSYFAGDINGHPPTPQQPGEAPQQQQQGQGAISLFRNNSVGRNRLVMTGGASSSGDQVCKPHGGFLSGGVSLASSFSTMKQAGEELSATRTRGRTRPRRSQTSYHPDPPVLSLEEEDEGHALPERAQGSKKSKTADAGDGKRKSDKGAPS